MLKALVFICYIVYLQIWVFGSCDQGVFFLLFFSFFFLMDFVETLVSVWLVRKCRKKEENVKVFFEFGVSDLLNYCKRAPLFNVSYESYDVVIRILCDIDECRIWSILGVFELYYW